MPAPEQMLSELSDHPPVAPTPVGRIRDRARRRVRRRRALRATAVLAVALAVGAGVASVADDDPVDDVSAGPGPESTEAPTTSASLPATVVPGESLVIDPSEGLVDGTLVSISLDDVDGGEVVIAQCAAEVGDVPGGDTSQILRWCPGLVYADAGQPLTYAVRRVLHTAGGSIDCAEPDRCVLAVRVDGVGGAEDRFAVLRFRDDLPPVVEPEVDVDGDEGTVGDGDRLLLTLTGVETGEDVYVAQCIADAAIGDMGAPADLCSTARSLTRTVRDGPETQVRFTAFHDVLVDATDDEAYLPGWTPCTPCVVMVSVGARTAPVARIPLEMEATDAPIRPQVATDPSGLVRPGQTVAVAATGLQPGSEISVGWCPTERLAGGGDPACDGANGTAADLVVADAEGTVRLDGLVVPTSDRAVVGVDCAVEGACGIGIDSGDQFSVMAIAPTTITP